MNIRTSLYYYLSVLIPIAANIAFFLLVFDSISQEVPQDADDWLLYSIKFLWFSGLLVALSNFIGLISFGQPDRDNLRVVKNFLARGGLESSQYARSRICYRAAIMPRHFPGQ